jgi:membrane protein YdbS with pleckstrin-like domain
MIATYIERNLMDDESLEHITRLHAIVLLAPAMIVSVLAGTLPIVSDIPVAWYVVAVFLLIAAIRLLDRLVLYLTSEFAVTSKRVLGKTGLIRLNTVDIVLAKVEAIRINQSILGRIFDFGDVLVTGTGGTVEVLGFIPDPVEFSKCIQEQLSLLDKAKVEEDAVGR